MDGARGRREGAGRLKRDGEGEDTGGLDVEEFSQDGTR